MVNKSFNLLRKGRPCQLKYSVPFGPFDTGRPTNELCRQAYWNSWTWNCNLWIGDQ